MNSPRPVLPTQLTSSTLRCSHFQVIITHIPLNHFFQMNSTFFYQTSLVFCPQQKNVFCLRERDLLERYTCEVAELQERGKSREFSFLLVSILTKQLVAYTNGILSSFSTSPLCLQSHQLSEYLSKAFAEKAILQAVLDAEAKLPAGSIKVNKVTVSHGQFLAQS